MSKGRFRRLICNSGYQEPIYQQFEKEIADQNSRMVTTTSFIGSIIMALLTLAALAVPSISKVLPLYLTTALVFGSIYAVIRFVQPQKSAAILACNYGFLLTAFFFSLGLDYIQGNPTATTVCVLLVALPLLIVDKPYREALFFAAISICFMLESVYLKQSPKASIDVLNAVSFLCIGSFLGYKHNQMMLRNIRGHSMLERQRDTDALTNLYNKGAFESRVRAYLEGNSGTAALMIFDMDNFKRVNDTYGHQAGDEILTKVGRLLMDSFRTGDYICRFGGDEFVAFLPGIGDKAALLKKAEQILAGMEQLRITADETYRAHLCIGIAAWPAGGRSFDELFKNADDAMYRVKKRGKNGCGYYDAARRPKLLVVDDIEMNRTLLKRTLEPDYEVLEAADGADALRLLAENEDVALVITDIQMPGMDGIELIRRIRADAARRDVALIANTQQGDPEQEKEILQLGVDDFVYKAASPSVIHARVMNVLKAKNRISLTGLPENERG